jgi:hypothetical protein
MLRRSQTHCGNSLRGRKKYPYMVSHNRLPWVTIEAGSPDSHKLFGNQFVRVFETAMSNRAPGGSNNSNNGGVNVNHAHSLVRTQHPALTVDEWLFHLPSTTYIIAETADDNAIPLEMVAPFEGWGATAAATATSGGEAADAAAEGDDAPCGKRVSDTMCLAHYGPLQSSVGEVSSVAEFRSPDLRIVGTAVRVLAPLKLKPAPLSAFWQLQKAQQQQFVSFALFHYYRQNRSPSELLAAFNKFTPRERPDLTALTGAEPLQGAASLGQRKKGAVVSPMPAGPVPTSPMYGLMEREAVKPGDTFGSRSRMWGHHW